MSNQPLGIMPQVDEPWGFAGIRRENRGVFADSRIFYVDPNHVLAVDDGNTGENPACPLLTIQKAITLARAYKGDTIYVLSSNSWQYGTGTQVGIAESVIVPFDKPGIRIIGVGGGPMGVYWIPGATTEFCITVNALDVEIAGFCFWGQALAAANGIYLSWSGVGTWGENTKIHHCYFTDDLEDRKSVV